jgi:hypothetical protein
MLTAAATESTLGATMGRVVAALVALLAAGTSVVAAPARCPDGRYQVVRDVPNVPSPQIALENGTITWGWICPPVKATFVASKRGTRVRASWPSCGEGRFGRINLVARFDPSCATMRGLTRDPKANTTDHFTATRLPAPPAP